MQVLNCSNCGQEISPAANFCRRCGVALGSVPSPEGNDLTLEPAVDADSSAQLPDLREAILSLQAQVARLSQRIGVLEGATSVPSPVAPDPVSPAAAQSPPKPAPVTPVTPAAAQSTPAPASVTPASPAAAQSPPKPAPVTPASPAAARLAPPPAPEASIPGGAATGERPPGNFPIDPASWDWEWLLGGNWLARVGIVALIIGVGFFLKLSFDNNWINETGRVGLGLAAGLALLGGGEYWRRKYPVWAQTLSGGGLAVLYLAIFAAFALYDLIPPLAALGFFSLVTIAAAGLALRYEAWAIAVLGIFGGFAAPLLLADRLPDQRILLAYVLVLDLGALALATLRNWRWFTLLGLAGSLLLFTFWWEQLEPSLLLAQAGITAIFLIFVGATTLFHLLWRRTPELWDYVLITLNAGAYFGISYWLLFNEFRPWMGGFTLLLALFYGLLAYGIILRYREQIQLSLFAVGIAVVFLTIAAPVQLGGPWISVAWAAEAVILVWLSFALKMRELRWFGLMAFLVLSVWLLVVDAPDALFAPRISAFNTYLIAYAVASAATYFAAFLIRRGREDLLPWESSLFPAFLVSGNLFLTLMGPMQAADAWIALVWALEGAILIILSFRLGLVELRWFGAGVLALTTARLLVFDAFVAMEAYRFLVNTRFLAFMVSIGAMYLSAYAFWRWRDKYFDPRERFLIPAFLVMGSFLALLVMTVEIREFAPPVVSDNWVALVWALGGLIMIGFSFRLNQVALRWFGVGVLALTTARLLVFDAFMDMEAHRFLVNTRFLAFMVSIGAMYLSAYAFWRWRDKYLDPRERFLIPAFLAAANLLSLVILSVEVIEYVEHGLGAASPEIVESVTSLVLGLLWALYAAALIVLGIVRRSRWVRIAGLGLLAIPVIKLFTFDAFQLEQEYRVAAFIGLGFILLIGGFLYQRYRRIIQEFLRD